MLTKAVSWQGTLGQVPCLGVVCHGVMGFHSDEGCVLTWQGTLGGNWGDTGTGAMEELVDGWQTEERQINEQINRNWSERCLEMALSLLWRKTTGHRWENNFQTRPISWPWWPSTWASVCSKDQIDNIFINLHEFIEKCLFMTGQDYASETQDSESCVILDVSPQSRLTMPQWIRDTISKGCSITKYRSDRIIPTRPSRGGLADPWSRSSDTTKADTRSGGAHFLAR